MSQANCNPSIQAEQIDVIRNIPTLNCQLEQNEAKIQNEQQIAKKTKNDCTFFQVPKMEERDCLLNPITVKQIESKQLAKSQNPIFIYTLFRIHASHQLGGVFLFIVTSIKLLGLNNLTTTSITISILIVISSLLWIISVAIGTLGIQRQKYNSLIFYFLGIIVSFVIEFSSTIIILATNHIADHQLGIYNKSVVVRIIIFMILEFMVVLFQIMMLRSVKQIRQLFIEIERLSIQNQSNNCIEIEKIL